MNGNQYVEKVLTVVFNLREDGEIEGIVWNPRFPDKPKFISYEHAKELIALITTMMTDDIEFE